MKNLLLLLSIFVFIACGNTSEKETTPAFTSEAKPQDDIPNFGIVIHGGRSRNFSKWRDSDRSSTTNYKCDGRLSTI